MAQEGSDILHRAAQRVREHYERLGTGTYFYHDLTHTQSVVEAARDIGRASGLDGEQLDAVLLACYFHDVGVAEQYHDHEEASCREAERFMEEHGFPAERRQLVRDCILATALTAEPRTLPEQVAADADLAHLAADDFYERSLLLRRERGAVEQRVYGDREWVTEQLSFMKGTRYHTKYARESFRARVEKNISRLKKRRKTMMKSAPVLPEKSGERHRGDRGSDHGAHRPERGVETMFRTAARSHVEFSAMVDNKASIMITVNTLVVTLVVSVLLRKLDTNPWMVLPTLVFLTVCLLTIVFAVLASRPRVTRGVFTREDIMQKKANLLFFGNFFNMPLEEFEWGMKEMIRDSDYLYSSMIRDFYFLGQVLGQKYRYMRISYNIFMYGLVLAIVLYLTVFFLYDPQGLPL